MSSMHFQFVYFFLSAQPYPINFGSDANYSNHHHAMTPLMLNQLLAFSFQSRSFDSKRNFHFLLVDAVGDVTSFNDVAAVVVPTVVVVDFESNQVFAFQQFLMCFI